MEKRDFSDVNEYIAAYDSGRVRSLLTQLRRTIKKAAPGADELISYHMPAYKFYGVLVYFAGYKNHIGFYPTPSGIEAFKKELSAYEGAKGSVRFPIDKPLPLNLIDKIVRFRIKENEQIELAKKTKSKKGKG